MKRGFWVPFSRTRAERDTRDEIAFHLAERVDALVAQGMSRADAERVAQERFGDRERIAAEIVRIDTTTHRRRSLREGIDILARDVRHAVRGLVRKPVYTAAVVLTLALGIGASTAIFSVFDTVLLRPLASPHLGQLFLLQNQIAALQLTGGLSVLEGEDLHRLTRVFAASTSLGSETAIVEIDDRIERRVGAQTTGDPFATFGVRPQIGRAYDARSSEPGQPSVIVLSDALWRELGGNPSIIGQTIDLGTARPEVIGVLGPEFDYPRGASYWRPRTVDPKDFPPNTRSQMFTTFVGRVHDGVSGSQLLSALRAEETRWRSEIGGYPSDAFFLHVVPLADALAGNLKPVVRALLAAVALLLLIASANVASLQLVRTASRSRESAVRAALGAGRASLVRAVVVESALLAVAGGVLGVGLARLAVLQLAGLDLAGFPMLRSLRIDGLVMGVAGVTVVLTGLAFGIWPALRAGRVDVSRALRAAGRGTDGSLGRHRAMRAGIVAQVAFTLVLLAGAGLMVRSLDRLLEVELGFDPEQVMTARIQLPSVFFANGPSRVATLDAIHERLRAVPGVQAVGFSNYLPFADGTSATGGSPYTVGNLPPQPGERRLHAGTVAVYGDYFAAMRIPFSSGAPFTRAEYGSPGLSAIIDEEIAQESFTARPAIGETIDQGRPGQIVGVIRSVKQYDLAEPRKGIVYWSYPHYAWFQTMNVVVRSTLAPEAAIAAIRAAVTQADPRIPIFGVRALTERVNDSLGGRRLAMVVLAGFGGASLVLALLGIYGVMTYLIGDRTREIGIRAALGAQRRGLVGLVLRDGGMLAGLGLAVGSAIFVSTAWFMDAMIYGVSARDPVSLAMAGALIAIATIAACYVPARRAAGVDAMVAMRGE